MFSFIFVTFNWLCISELPANLQFNVELVDNLTWDRP